MLYNSFLRYKIKIQIFTIVDQSIYTYFGPDNEPQMEIFYENCEEGLKKLN